MLGASIRARNLVVDRGELDLIVEFGSARVAVEVKTSTVDLADAIERFDEAKHRQVRGLSSRAGCHRVDLVGVHLAPDGFYVRWIPNVA